MVSIPSDRPLSMVHQADSGLATLSRRKSRSAHPEEEWSYFPGIKRLYLVLSFTPSSVGALRKVGVEGTENDPCVRHRGSVSFR